MASVLMMSAEGRSMTGWMNCGVWITMARDGGATAAVTAGVGLGKTKVGEGWTDVGVEVEMLAGSWLGGGVAAVVVAGLRMGDMKLSMVGVLVRT